MREINAKLLVQIVFSLWKFANESSTRKMYEFIIVLATKLL